MKGEEVFVLHGYTFRTWPIKDWRRQQRHALTHEGTGRSASTHALGPTIGLPDLATVRSVAQEHALQINDIGNCRGLIPVQRAFGQAVHMAEIPRWTGYPVYQRTACGLRLSAPAPALRVFPGGLDRVTCQKCRGH